jgi:hypothetical protein
MTALGVLSSASRSRGRHAGSAQLCALAMEELQPLPPRLRRAQGLTEYGIPWRFPSSGDAYPDDATAPHKAAIADRTTRRSVRFIALGKI